MTHPAECRTQSVRKELAVPEIPVRRREGGGMPWWIWVVVLLVIVVVGWLLLNALT